MKLTVAGKSYSIVTKNRSGTLTVAPVIGISRYPYRDSPNASPKIGPVYIAKMWIRTKTVQVTVGTAPHIGDIVAVMWTPFSRYSCDDIQYFIINEKNNNIPITVEEVIAHFAGDSNVFAPDTTDTKKA